MPGCRGRSAPSAGEDGGGAGAAGQRLHAVVRSAGDDAVRQMPVRAASRIVGEHDTRLWRIVHHYGRGAGASRPVRSAPGGHRRDGQPAGSPLHQRVRGSGPGESGACGARQGWRQWWRASPRIWPSMAARRPKWRKSASTCRRPFRRGCGASARGPDHLDKFHVTRLLNQAVDQVRRAEQGQRAELKRTRYLWLKTGGT